MLSIRTLVWICGQKQFCAFVGFFNLWISTIVYIFIIINLLLVYSIYKLIQGKPFPRLSNSKYPRIILEYSLTFLIIFLPLTYLWLPLTKNSKLNGTESGGLNAFCWINDIEKDWKTIQPYSQIVYTETILIGIACILHILFTIGIAVAFCRLAYTYRRMKHKHIKNVRDVLLLMCFLLVSVVFDSPAVVFLSVTTWVTPSPMVDSEVHLYSRGETWVLATSLIIRNDVECIRHATVIAQDTRLHSSSFH